MADSDNISDSTPVKRRKITHEPSTSKAWDEENDSGDDLFGEHETIATLPVTASQRPQQLGYSSKQFHNDIASMSGNAKGRTSSPSYITQPTQPISRTFATQPTQPLESQTLNHVTQPTQPLKRNSPSDDVQVMRSSPPAEGSDSQMGPPPAPIRRAPFAKPSLLASAMAPPGTAFRRPMGVQQKAPVVNLDDSDDEKDAPVSSDEETQGRSHIKKTNWTKGGRGLNSSPNLSSREGSAVVKESPKPTENGTFAKDVSRFAYSGSPPARRAAPDDMASAYGGGFRMPKVPNMRQTGPAKALPVINGEEYKTLDDIHDWSMRKKVERIKSVFGDTYSISRCMDALRRHGANEQDAMEFLSSDDVDELAPTPVKAAAKGIARGVAHSSSSQLSQPIRPAVKPSARQEVDTKKQSIAERYGVAQARKPSQPKSSLQEDDDVPKPRKRLLGRNGQTVRSASPESSPPPQKKPQPLQRLKARQPITIDSDDDEQDDSGVVSDDDDDVQEVVQADPHEIKLLKYLNEAALRDIVDLCALPEQDVQAVVDKRPFNSLDEIRIVSNVPEVTKSGKKSRSKPVGDKIVDACSEMMIGYDAVDDLVAQCEQIAKPIQEALKSWGVGTGNGELQLMNLDEAHDSGIGTPQSSYHSDDPPASKGSKKKTKGRFLGQPSNMNPDIQLKDYQLVGLNWLNLLWEEKKSCILADDMGLGKTCQVISFLSHLQEKEVDGVHLVVVPGSTLENWLREFAHFSPELKVVPYYGSQAERPHLQDQIETDFDTIDVIVTTYDMTKSSDDNKFLRGLGPAVCVYDEAHALRNPNSDRYTQLMRIPADFKILLTGTPLQNNLQELVAILAFILPNIFSEKKEQLDYIFQHKATTKDADHAALLSAQRIARARTMMTPFILRRKKQQVLSLPAKHSRVEYCDMTDSQANMYADEIDAAQQVLVGQTNGKKVNAKASSNVIMSLRKAAIHPLLSRRIYNDKKLEKIQSVLLKNEEFRDNPPDRVWKYLIGEGPQKIKGGDFGLHRFCEERPYLKRFELKKEEWMDCGKVQKFKELVSAYQKNGDRALVFSQFTTLMDILEAVLETMGVRYMRLDGSTRMDTRQDMIDKFSTDPSITVFMLSTKAGGAGINLAAANKVIIFDSGFNPQDDIQAENRAHRVGQTREVEVVRLVTKGTIEEQIHALGESKLALDERVAGEGAGADEDKAAEKAGEKAVQESLLRQLKGEDKGGEGGDLKDAFKKGLEDAGLNVS